VSYWLYVRSPIFNVLYVYNVGFWLFRDDWVTIIASFVVTCPIVQIYSTLNVALYRFFHIFLRISSVSTFSLGSWTDPGLRYTCLLHHPFWFFVFVSYWLYVRSPIFNVLYGYNAGFWIFRDDWVTIIASFVVTCPIVQIYSTPYVALYRFFHIFLRISSVSTFSLGSWTDPGPILHRSWTDPGLRYTCLSRHPLWFFVFVSYWLYVRSPIFNVLYVYNAGFGYLEMIGSPL
jgi:hypothetical protein